MRVLLIHNRYQIAGGEDEVVRVEQDLLKANGNQVALLEVSNENITSPFEKIRTTVRAVYSNSSRRRVRLEIDNFMPDVVHIHNFFPMLSPSIYDACRDAAVPVVQTLHNYRLFCLNAYFFREGGVCEDCFSYPIPLPGVVHGCYRESRAGSAAVAAMLSIHRALRTWDRMVDAYITLTEFAREKFIQGRLPPEKIFVKPNFVYPDPGQGAGQGGYALFVGRLSPEKGLETLFQAWQTLGTRLPLKIVGDGFMSHRVARASQEIPGVEWLGRLPKEKVLGLMKEAEVLIFPSEWYEGFPLVIAEAYAVGLPVITSNLGSMSSLIHHGRTGLHFHPGDSEDLVTQVEWVLAHPLELVKMRQEARLEFESKYTAEQNYKMLMDLYERAVMNV